MDRKAGLFNRTDEEWKGVYESGASEYYEDRADFYHFQLEEKEVELDQLRGRIATELEAINRHIAVTPRDSKWWTWSHGVKDALEAMLEE